MRKLLTGNEAVAQGAYEAGVTFAAAYPGTPSTEILENIAEFKKDIIAEWAPNEKVALESAIGASIAGARSLAAMKMVGVNVAADPLFSFAYTGVNGGMLLITADDPGLHSSQNEQDNRYYAKFAKIPMIEPSDSQESKDMIKVAMEISEKFDTPVLMRMTTRVCHSKSIVEIGERQEVGKKPYVKNLAKYDLMPAISRKLRAQLNGRLKELEQYSNETSLNYFEWNESKIGIITSGIAYQHTKEVFDDTVSYLKLGFTYPLPLMKIREFATKMETLYIVEELEPYLEEQIKQAGIACIGKEKIPNMYELNPDIIAKSLIGTERQRVQYDSASIASRPPVLCAGCPHRGFFYELSKIRNVMVSGDIGCYALGGSAPLSAKDSAICMGGAPSIAHGAQKIFNKFNENMRVVATIGDSTFFHTGINSIMDIAYNNSNTITCILDNRITGMTGHQDHPGTGFTLQGMPTKALDIAAVVKAVGIDHVRVINPLILSTVKSALEWALSLDEPSVIITRWPCVLKKQSQIDKDEFGNYMSTCEVKEEKCIGCKLCIWTGCPALRFDKGARKAKIDPVQCVACQVCVQVCPQKAISRVGE
ncbi:indolepyruvate ferredoxin oxidoreductase subunit alpha [Pelosinus baikalensis]|uniref:Indolepyruvate oxidoreductase subunit IorA n=1 Tax=Pelosinus baikalensis TaxID=2892015 RepID=A0ABS8HVL7_9FIRM|nr:indolepyruvate ferredoxin oxidoreductase subunit alpha [Pelosinus baikalensis]MCC5466313.1 indolepyruvate ferredoxin oxidoreductase subunit alpha [Pelosinus baikalensis]